MSDSQHSPLAIEALIAGRLRDLKLTPVELISRCDYTNVSKGCGGSKLYAKAISSVPTGLFSICRKLSRCRPRRFRTPWTNSELPPRH